MIEILAKPINIVVWKVSVFVVILVQMQENMDQNNSEYGHTLRSVCHAFQVKFFSARKKLFCSLISQLPTQFSIWMQRKIWFRYLNQPAYRLPGQLVTYEQPLNLKICFLLAVCFIYIVNFTFFCVTVLLSKNILV